MLQQDFHLEIFLFFPSLACMINCLINWLSRFNYIDNDQNFSISFNIFITSVLRRIVILKNFSHIYKRKRHQKFFSRVAEFFILLPDVGNHDKFTNTVSIHVPASHPERKTHLLKRKNLLVNVLQTISQTFSPNSTQKFPQTERKMSDATSENQRKSIKTESRSEKLISCYFSINRRCSLSFG